MSAATSDWRPEWENARDALHNVEEGDEIKYADVKESLTVTDVGGTTENEDHYVVAAGPRGGTYTIREQYTPSGAPDYSDDRGRNANNLRIVDKAGAEPAADDETPRVEPDETTMQDDAVEDRDPDSPGHYWPQADDLPDGPTGDEVGINRPPEPNAREIDADLYVSEVADNPFAEYDDLLENNLEGELEEAGIFFGQETNTWTFVDELTSFGVDVPKVVNNWLLVDYGVVRNNTSRRIAWYNVETDELLVLLAMRPDDGPLTWHVVYTDNPDIAEADQISPDPHISTRDPYEAINYIENFLYDDVDDIDIQIIESQDGEITVKDEVSNEELGERVIENHTPYPDNGDDEDERDYSGIQGQFQRAYDISATLVGRAADDVVRWADENAETVGRVTKFAIVYGVAAVTERLFGFKFSPVISRKELGVDVEYKYEGEHDEWVKGAIDGKFTVDPRQFNLDERNYTRLGLGYEELVDASTALSVEEFGFHPPGYTLIRQMRVKPDGSIVFDPTAEFKGATAGAASTDMVAEQVKEQLGEDAAKKFLEGEEVPASGVVAEMEGVEQAQAVHQQFLNYYLDWGDEKGLDDDEEWFNESRISSKAEDFVENNDGISDDELIYPVVNLALHEVRLGGRDVPTAVNLALRAYAKAEEEGISVDEAMEQIEEDKQDTGGDDDGEVRELSEVVDAWLEEGPDALSEAEKDLLRASGYDPDDPDARREAMEAAGGSGLSEEDREKLREIEGQTEPDTIVSEAAERATDRLDETRDMGADDVEEFYSSSATTADPRVEEPDDDPYRFEVEGDYDNTQYLD